jgi:hypothetical protein
LLDDVIEQTRAKRNTCVKKQWKFELNGKKIILRDIADKIIVWIDKFKIIGDLASQFDPIHAALPWAGFRFLLQVRLCFWPFSGRIKRVPVSNRYVWPDRRG